MRRNLVDTSEFLARLETAENAKTCQVLLDEHLRGHGISRFTYVRMNPPTMQDRSYFYSTFPSDWLSHYVANDYIYIDPLILKARREVYPMQWGPRHPLPVESKRQETVVLESNEAGNVRGIAVPIRGFRGEFAMMSLIVAEDSDDHFDRFYEDVRYGLHLSCLYFHHALWKRVHHEDQNAPATLSARQVEVLRLAAAGKTAWEIAVILGITEDGVRYHFKEAGARLGTFGITATVAKAIAFGYITA